MRPGLGASLRLCIFLRLLGERFGRFRAGFRRCCEPARLAADAIGNALHAVVLYVVLHSCMVGEADWLDCKGFRGEIYVQWEVWYGNELDRMNGLCRLIEEH